MEDVSTYATTQQEELFALVVLDSLFSPEEDFVQTSMNVKRTMEDVVTGVSIQKDPSSALVGQGMTY